MTEYYTTKCRSFTTESIEEMEDILNEFFINKFIVSSPIMLKDNQFICMVYYKVKGIEVMDTEQSGKLKEIERASDKQIWLLKKLGYTGTLDLTITDAHHLIKQFKEKNEKSN